MPATNITTVFQSVRHHRQGWEAKFTELAKQGDDRLLDDLVSTQWDEDDWTW